MLKRKRRCIIGKSTPSAPAAPDPAATSAAQTQSNQQTALYNFGLNNPNVNSPLGSSTYTQTSPGGYNNDAYKQALDKYYADSNAQFAATGKGFSAPPPTLEDFKTGPQYRQDIKLSPEVQRIYDINNQNVTQQGQAANTALNNVSKLFNTPYDLKGNVQALPSQQDLQKNLDDTRNALYSQSTQYLDPQFQQSQAQLESQLANQGIPRGSQAWNTAMQNHSLEKQRAYSDARNNAIAGGTAAQAQYSQTGLANQAQQAQMYTQQYQNPLNLYSSLISGTQPTLPQFAGASGSSAAPTNVLGAYQNQYQGQLNNYNAQVGAQNSQNQALGSLLGTAGQAAFMFSDIRLKKNIKRIGKLKNNLPVYEYSYIWEDKLRQGVMAQDVMHVIPQAVITMPSGYMAVNYSMLGE